MERVKINDSNSFVTQGSRADQYWKQNGWENLFDKIRPGLKLPKSISNDSGDIAKKFNLKGIGYGNWLSIEDKINYTYALMYSFYDLNKVLNFKYNIGMGLLSITFGARGRSKALAHYEPQTNYINITRYHNGANEKKIRFFTSGGVGSLAHEYGHFLDYFAGEFFAKNDKYFSLTNGNSIAKGRTGETQPLRVLMDNIMEAIIWETPEKKYSRYYERLDKFISQQGFGNYWIQRNEIFARAFEVYISLKLAENNVNNRLLAKTKYISSVYLKSSEIKPIIPLFDKLVSEIRKRIN